MIEHRSFGGAGDGRVRRAIAGAERNPKFLVIVERVASGRSFPSVVVKTGATLPVKEGIKACAKTAAKELMQQVASGLAAELANYAKAAHGSTACDANDMA